MVLCPKCLGTKEVYTGKYIKKCNLCIDGFVKPEIEEAYIDEQKYFDDE